MPYPVGGARANSVLKAQLQTVQQLFRTEEESQPIQGVV